jgi:chromosome segregation ATPase
MKTKTESALEALEEREREIEAAETRLAELETKRKQVQRSLDDAVKPLRAYYREVESGHRMPDRKQEAKLRQDLTDAQARIAPMASFNPRAAMGSDQVKLVDPELEGQIDGARERVRAAVTDYNRFRSAHFDDLVVELGTLGTEFAQRYELVIKHSRRAAKEWKALKRRWEPILEVSDFERSDFPPSPFESVHSEPLMPRKLRRGEPVEGPRTAGARRARR